MHAPKFFRLGIENENGKIVNVGSKVFENHSFHFYNGLDDSNVLLNIIYVLLANKDIKITENELEKRGFAPVDITGISEKLLSRVPIIRCNNHLKNIRDLYKRDDALVLLNNYLPLMTDDLRDFLGK